MASTINSYEKKSRKATVPRAPFLGPDAMRLAITKERMRSDRHHLVFSTILLFIHSSSPEDQKRKTHRLTEILNDRLRLTDERGIIESGEIAILLPHTNSIGARTVIESLTKHANESQIEFHIRVFTYPETLPYEIDCQDDSDSDHHHRNRRVGSDHDSKLIRIDDSEASSPLQPMVLQHFDESLVQHLDPVSFIAPKYPAWKRAMDIVFALIGLVLASPILLVAAIAIKLTSRGPILFRQWRTGCYDRPFYIAKLRTMVVDAEELKTALHRDNERDGPAFKIKCDPRVTTVGKFLRATGFDELPQLWNVLKGEMAIVGPRPLPCDEDAQCEQWHRRRLDTKPGITCIWQISKSRKISFDDWMRMDLQYSKNRSMWQDISLMFKTVAAVVLGRVGH